MADPKSKEREITHWGWFLWAWITDAFGKAWWVVGIITIVLPFLDGFVKEDEPTWGHNETVAWLHGHADFTIPFWLAIAVCLWRILKAPHDLFKIQKKKADDSLAKIAAIENAKPVFKVELASRHGGPSTAFTDTVRDPSYQFL